MGSTSYLAKPKSAGYRIKSGSSNAGSDKEMNGKLKRNKIRRPTKMSEYGLKRVPDYTEMAYKEAVSKLRYFLSGNYAPSVRSYGSPSIRNLDESDGDQKYAHSPAFADLKARPRLTTKYATLYADSLNNYTPPTYVPTTVPPVSSVGAGADSTNPDVVNFIQKQEEYIEQLERESQYCRDELNNLLGKVKEVITENEHLHEAQKNKLITRMFHSYNAGSETDDLDDIGDSTGLDSDNKISPSKSRKSSAKHRGSKLEGPNIVFESRIAELEAQLTQAKIDLKKIQEENNENKRKLASGLVDSTCLDGFKRQIDNLQRDKSALENQISKLKMSLEQRDEEGRYKRGDSVELQLREERNNLEAELRRLKEELAKERGKVRELAGEGARRAMQERGAAEQRYHAHCDELQRDLDKQYDNVAKLQLELERQRREENDLKRELSMKNSAIEELKMEIKNKSSSLQADLAQAHAEKASLEEELASARLAIERQQRQAKHETNRLNSEIQSLRQRLDRADADLVHSRRENLRLSEQIATLEKEMNMKSLTPMTPEKNKKEKELSSKLESMENKHAKTVAELETMIHSQNSLMEKLTGECRLLTDKLDDANRRHKTERVQLLCRNSELMRKLRNLWSSHKKYCTTSVPLRSYTSLSGYPHSRSSYDLDRTYYTSTPYNRFRRESRGSDVGELIRNLSDLSIDRIDGSDDDPAKVRYKEELATLQRQVDGLGRSLQSTPRAQSSTYQAPTTPAATAHRDVPAVPSARRDDPRAEPPSHPAHPSPVPPPLQRDLSRASLVKQASRTSLYSQPDQTKIADTQNEPNSHTDTTYTDSPNDAQVDTEIKAKEPKEEYEQQNYDGNYEQPYEQTQPTEYEQTQQEYEQPQQEYEQPQPEYEQPQPEYAQPQPEYEQPQPTEYEQTQPTEYDQNYEQPAYTEGQYENYEYTDPNAQYTDPNAQYEGNYEGYAADPNYQEQAYDNTQYAPEYQTTPQVPENKDEVPSQS